MRTWFARLLGLTLHDDFVGIRDRNAIDHALHGLPRVSIAVETRDGIKGLRVLACGENTVELRDPLISTARPYADRISAIGTEVPRLEMIPLRIVADDLQTGGRALVGSGCTIGSLDEALVSDPATNRFDPGPLFFCDPATDHPFQFRKLSGDGRSFHSGIADRGHQPFAVGFDMDHCVATDGGNT